MVATDSHTLSFTLSSELPLKVTQKLQLIQNAAARLVAGSGRRDHITPVLKDLHWLPVRFRAQFKVLVLTFKALNGLSPVYLKERLHPHRSAWTLRSSAEGLLTAGSEVTGNQAEGLLSSGTHPVERPPIRCQGNKQLSDF